MSKLTGKESKEYKAWIELRKVIANSTPVPVKESVTDKQKRVEKLLNNFDSFCYYYFPHYIKSPFGWFHKEAAKEIEADPNIFAVLEWPREHAKSVYADILLPLFLKAKGELTGMMLGSANENKANVLLADVQAELMSNQRYINDFGEQFRLGDWQSGHFVTADGCGFWAFGRGQSPRGTRKADKRPNYGVIDDIDDATIVKNEKRVQDAVDWVLGDFFGAMSIKGARLIIAGNRIHKKSILANLVGDIEPDDPKREGIYHLKVFAIQKAEGKSKKAIEEGNVSDGVPAWKERYSIKELDAKMKKMGYRNAQREFFHKHIEQGFVFKSEHITWATTLPLKQYDALITYNDPSFKDTKSNDYKAIVLIGRKGSHYHIIKAWVRQTTSSTMVQAHYDLHDFAGDNSCKHYMEANFMQDLLLDEYDAEAEERGYHIMIRPDKRKKPEKFGRIENLSPMFERKFITFAADQKKDPDMQTLVEQFLGFPYAHDDGPDAVEGAIFLLQKKGGRKRSGKTGVRTGKYTTSNQRRG